MKETILGSLAKKGPAPPCLGNRQFSILKGNFSIRWHFYLGDKLEYTLDKILFLQKTRVVRLNFDKPVLYACFWISGICGELGCDSVWNTCLLAHRRTWVWSLSSHTHTKNKEGGRERKRKKERKEIQIVPGNVHSTGRRRNRKDSAKSDFSIVKSVCTQTQAILSSVQLKTEPLKVLFIWVDFHLLETASLA